MNIKETLKQLVRYTRDTICDDIQAINAEVIVDNFLKILEFKNKFIPPTVTMNDILDTVAQYYGLSFDDLINIPKGRKFHAKERNIAYYIMNLAGYKIIHIADYYKRGRPSISVGVKKVREEYMQYNPDIKADILIIINEILLNHEREEENQRTSTIRSS